MQINLVKNMKKINVAKKETHEDPFSKKFREFYNSKKASDPKMRGKTTPTGVHNFDAFSEFESIHRIKRILAKLPVNGEFRVLFDGFSTPSSVTAMQTFLVNTLEIDPTKIRLHAIDLDAKAMIKATKVAKKKGINFSFEVSDARSLPFKDGFFSMVFQDFLLNCAPIAMHGEIIDETNRTLEPETGFAIIGFTSLDGHKKRMPIFSLNEMSFEQHNPLAFKIEDFALPQDQKKLRKLLEMHGQFLFSSDEFGLFQEFNLVTPNEDLEFFRSRVNMMLQLEAVELTPIETRLDIGPDRFGNVCWRNRIICTKNPEFLAVENPELLGNLGGDND